LAKGAVGIRFNEHLEFNDGEAVFNHACRMGLEGIVSKRKDSTYRSGRSPDWLEMKNPACEAVRREAEAGRPVFVALFQGAHPSFSFRANDDGSWNEIAGTGSPHAGS
jgi:hypothetical protein